MTSAIWPSLILPVDYTGQVSRTYFSVYCLSQSIAGVCTDASDGYRIGSFKYFHGVALNRGAVCYLAESDGAVRILVFDNRTMRCGADFGL